MSLSITHISFANFRSYQTFDLDQIGPLTIFVGPNAVGKTNIIEGIQLLTSQSSFRHSNIEELLHAGETSARIMLEAGDEQRKLQFEMRIEDKKKFFLNGKFKHAADLKGLLPSVIFTPDDLELAKGPMAPRRTALDMLGSQLSPNHYLFHRDYEKVLRHKNSLLKNNAQPLLIDSINEMLITCGTQLIVYRTALFQKLSEHMSGYYSAISGGKEQLSTRYIPSWETHNPSYEFTHALSQDEVRENLSKSLELRNHEELERRRSLVGPHADKIEFFIDGQNVSLYGSQGQQRSVVLAFKLSEATLIEDILHLKPILLLDDVMSELDEVRRRALVSFVEENIQTFITTANIDYFDTDLLKKAQVVQLPLTSKKEEV